MSILDVTLGQLGATVGLATELLMLKEMILRFGDILGLASSSSDSSLLCFKKTNQGQLEGSRKLKTD